jgi:hypothetical protein
MRAQRLWLVLAALCLGVVLSPTRSATQDANAKGKELIAVLDLQPVGASEPEAQALTDRLREVLLDSGQFVLVDRSQMEAVLEEQALQQTGCTSQECAVQVGRILGVRKLVAGKVVKISEDVWLLTALLVDVETAQTLKVRAAQGRLLRTDGRPRPRDG